MEIIGIMIGAAIMVYINQYLLGRKDDPRKLQVIIAIYVTNINAAAVIVSLFKPEAGPGELWSGAVTIGAVAIAFGLIFWLPRGDLL